MWQRLLPIVLAAHFVVAAGFCEQEASTEGESAAVIATVQAFFDTMTTCDVEAARKLLSLEGRFFRVRVDGENGEYSSASLERFLEGLGKCEEEHVERMWDPEVFVQDGIALLWAPYDFWRNGELSHCGIDGINLVATDEGWKITGGVYSVQAENCPPSPLGPLEK